MIVVVGIGPGSAAYLTSEARQAIAAADILVGGARHLAMFPDFNGQTRRLDADIDGLMKWLDEQKSHQVVVLASGDPLLFGIGKRLSVHFSPDELLIIPGISAIQYLCARIALDMNDIYLTSCHGRAPDFDWILQHDKVAMVTDSRIGPRAIADAVVQRRLSRTLIVGENLSLPDERIHRLQPHDVAQHYDINVVVILNER
ncbi:MULTISPECIES: cobalt-precorrin-7 (C(5))-methyltransferase [unclassified Brenneria]|uniref:cobalt-precorrin-7 (C(5))-methyltransferase n=1 Tax=unclassified Brenneria TaxID=2634434 RepID=UPI001556F43F|nr:MULTISPECIES: cobalt-precorrin-7 (C(5))-methyltransferase [unclassified Brenneria]MBJ7221555.1 cobalt-precorrin-7 (C(5))-methyltransferase [Brenneria sp. L3-3C-1]MEE3642797.1 cobalt-precorrin-7 (C(5))-methyltransferase [Brenneria sp. L3_3C_1]MEE3651021.1 cobalt-precorrin-7 (C(5))-methyltransferase [Brenneria sp. HEZEL_4_2_4]NPD00976.1 cobalt-precorrin-7 (C(5))-methyltransferase [Brenneria sp. hezel4-2-4]